MYGISTIFVVIGLLLAPGCIFAEDSYAFAGESKSTFQSQDLNPLEKGGGSRGGGFSSSKSSSSKKLKTDGDDDNDTDDDDGSGFPWWAIFLIIIIVLLVIGFVVYKVFF